MRERGRCALYFIPLSLMEDETTNFVLSRPDVWYYHPIVIILESILISRWGVIEIIRRDKPVILLLINVFTTFSVSF